MTDRQDCEPTDGEEPACDAGRDGFDGEARRTTNLNRRHLLTTLGATVGAGSLAGCSGGDDDPGPDTTPERETKEFEARAAGFGRSGVAKLGLPAAETNAVERSREATVAGDTYVVDSTHKITTYGAEKDLRYTFGILSSPLARFYDDEANDETITSPVANRDLSEFLPSDLGEQLLTAMGVPTAWTQPPRRVDRVEGASLFESEPVEVYEYTNQEGEEVERWHVALVRGWEEYEEEAVVLACAVGDVSTSVPAADRARDLAFTGAPEVHFESFQTDSMVTDAPIADLRMVQTVEDSTLERDDEQNETIPDPPIVANEPAAALFELDAEFGTRNPAPAYLRAQIRVSGPDTPDGDLEFDIRRDDLVEMSSQYNPAAAVFDLARRTQGTWTIGSETTDYDLGLPVFSVGDGGVSVSVDIMTPVGHPVSSGEIEQGTDFEVASVPTLTVGFIEVQDPGVVKSTDIDYGDANGRAKNYERSVRSSFEYLRRAYPGQVVGYRHDTPMLGHSNEEYDKGDARDARKARKTMNFVQSRPWFPGQGEILAEGVTEQEAVQLMHSKRGGSFDVRVMILPKGTASGNRDYYAAHGDDDVAGLYWGRKWAVGSLEANQGGGDIWHAGVTAQEIGHRFATDIYDGTFARWDADDGEDDDAHIHEDVHSVGYDLTDGTFTVITAPQVTDGTFSTEGPPTKTTGHDVETYDSYMSYGDPPFWADSKTHGALIDGSFDPTYASSDGDGTHSRDDTVQPVIEAFGTIADGLVQFDSSAVYDTVPEDARGETDDSSHHPEASTVEVTLRDPNGKVLQSATVSDRVGHTHGDGTADSVAVSLPFPADGISLVAKRDGQDTELNAIVDPLLDAVGRLPERGLADDGDALSAARDRLEEVASLMDDGKFGSAADVLDGPFREYIQDGVRAEYDRFASEPVRESVIALTERMIDRLSGLDGGEGQQLECGTSLPPNITEDTVLQEGCTYTIPESQNGVQITEGATLAVQPGVEIKVGAGTEFTVSEDGAISAQGTEENPIEIYGSSEERGHWSGIEIQSDDPANELSYVTVAHAGDIYWDTAINVVQQATIRNCTVRESSSAGIKLHESAELVDFRNNHVENTQGPPLRIHPAQLASLTGTTTVANNDESRVLVQPDMGHGGRAITEDGTWPALDLPYEVTGEIDIQSDIDIEPGATFQFQQGGPIRLFVSKDGRLVADASGGDPITFRGVQGTPGSWAGIYIRTTRDNRFDNVVVRDGGEGYRDANIGIGIDGEGALTIRNSVIGDGASTGVLATNSAELVEFGNNTFENMQGPPLELHPDRVGSLSGTSTFGNNDESYVLVGSDDNNVTEDATWPAMNVPYQFSNTVSIQSDVDIEPGATLEFQQGGPIRLFVGSDGQLVADASGGDPITFRGVQGTPGSWGGIFVRTTRDNRFDNVVVSDGGEGYRDANIGVGIDGEGALTITDSDISDSAGWGIILDNGSLTAENNTFRNNAKGDIQRPDG
jgi:hypothetical protein